MNEQPRTIPIHVSLIRPILLMGAERELVLISAIIAAVLVMSLERPLFTVIGVVFWALTVAALQRAAKNDPLVQPRVFASHALSRVLRCAVAPNVTRFGRAGGHAVLALREFRSTAKGLPDLLNYAAVVDDGIVLNKDGSVMAAWMYRGEDLDSASAQELSALSARVNAAFARRGSGWMVHVDALRTEARGYPEIGAFPDRTTLLIDAERRNAYEAEGAHYESRYVLAVTYLPPIDAQSMRSPAFSSRATVHATTPLRLRARSKPSTLRLWISRITCPRHSGWCASVAAESRIRLGAATFRTTCCAT